MQNNYFLKLVDTNEPSNFYYNPLTNTLHTTSPFKLEPQHNSNTFEKNKLIILCSDEETIATNSPNLTPNCYISEDRVKEFVEYWNKYKELPKFEIKCPHNMKTCKCGQCICLICEMVLGSKCFSNVPNSFQCDLTHYNNEHKSITPIINNILQIKWLPK
jgi:hypothetical protein